ncbi:unnamed protein product [Phytomonas sp. EM1]|nr:unnamed protein product [Phytomonas sp. EM1]|eukprot:CCW59715.1 unnamed protein product [Phytomonas sp. isolate EM1]
MTRITIELLRRRSEHNEGCLSNLKEITLHQQDIEKIELIGDICRQLEIVYLCNNYISKIEGLIHLKWLKYLNLAINNITRIEGLEGCESLERLDLTLNFIADLSTVDSLLANPFLETLHLTGNPCTQIEGYRAYVLHTLPHIKDLDGEEIIRADRITARQSEAVISETVGEEALKAREAERIKAEMIAKGIDPFPPKYNDKGERVYGHTPEERLQMLREQENIEAERRRKQEEPVPGSISALHKELNAKKKPLTPEEEIEKYGRLLLRNEGKVPFEVDQDGPEEVVVTVEPGKFISTTLLNVQVEVNCIRVYIKGKLLQIPLEVELSPDKARVQRSSTTGQLKVMVPLTEAEREARSRRSYLRFKTRFASKDMADDNKAGEADAFGSKGDGCAGENAEKENSLSRAGNKLPASAACGGVASDAGAASQKTHSRKDLLFPEDLAKEESKGLNVLGDHAPNSGLPRSLIKELNSFPAPDVETKDEPRTLLDVD